MMRSLLFLWLAGFLGLAQARDIAPAELPPEARHIMHLIVAGGPFPHRRDGIVFNNLEKQLPPRARGYYREYTVPTPGVQHRGARRIVCGGKQLHAPEACYYTADHYGSFRKIRE